MVHFGCQHLKMEKLTMEVPFMSQVRHYSKLTKRHSQVIMPKNQAGQYIPRHHLMLLSTNKVSLLTTLDLSKEITYSLLNPQTILCKYMTQASQQQAQDLLLYMY